MDQARVGHVAPPWVVRLVVIGLVVILGMACAPDEEPEDASDDGASVSSTGDTPADDEPDADGSDGSTSASPLDMEWDRQEIPLPDGDYGEARIVGAHVVATAGDEIRAFADDPGPVWVAPCADAAWLGPFSVEAGVLVVCDGVVTQLDASTGAERWSNDAIGGDSFRASTDLLAWGAGDAVSVARLSDGSEQWSRTVGFRPFTLDGDRMYMGASGQVIAIDAEADADIWQTPPAPGWATSFLVGDGDGVYAVHEDGTDLARLGDDGSVEWVVDPGPEVLAASGLWATDAGVLVVRPAASVATMLSREDGSVLWTHDEFTGQVLPSASGSIVAVTDVDDGSGVVVDAFGGEPVLAVDGPVVGLVAVAETEAEVAWIREGETGPVLVLMSGTTPE